MFYQCYKYTVCIHQTIPVSRGAHGMHIDSETHTVEVTDSVNYLFILTSLHCFILDRITYERSLYTRSNRFGLYDLGSTKCPGQFIRSA